MSEISSYESQFEFGPFQEKIETTDQVGGGPSNRAAMSRKLKLVTDALCKTTLSAEIEAVRAKLMAVRQETTQLRAEKLELQHLKYQLEEQLKVSEARQAIP